MGVTRSPRGFTLIELFVVVTIIVIVMTIAAIWASSIRSGPPLEIASSSIASMVSRIRQVCATQRVHGELVVDYKNDRIVALARSRHFTFAFEDPAGAKDIVGGLDIFGKTGGNPEAELIKSRQDALRDGGCLELVTEGSRFTVPWLQQFETDSSGYQGIALAFDFFPLGQGTGTICTLGTVFTLSVSEFGKGGLRLHLASGTESVTCETILSRRRWYTLELAVSRYSLRLYVDGRLSPGQIKDPNFRVPLGGSPLEFAGFACRIDNLQMFSLISSQELELGVGGGDRRGSGVRLLPDDVDPQLEIDNTAENIYIGDETSDGDPRDTITRPVEGDIGLGGPGLPLFRPPPIRTVYFDQTGKLDPAVHGGAVVIYLVSRATDGRPERMEILIQPLGVVTARYLQRFPWEQPPEQQPPDQSPPGKKTETSK